LGAEKWTASPQQIDEIHVVLEHPRFSKFANAERKFRDELPLSSR